MFHHSNPKFPLPPCRICNAPGTGFHYGVNSCEACKGFFHRSLKLWKKYICLSKEGHCVIQHGNGLLCRLCRYNRCLKMGMSKSAIKTGRYNYKKKTDDILEVKQLREQGTIKTLENRNTHTNSESELRGTSSNNSGHQDILIQIKDDSDTDEKHLPGNSFIEAENIRSTSTYHSKNEIEGDEPSKDLIEENFVSEPREKQEKYLTLLTTKSGNVNDIQNAYISSSSSPISTTISIINDIQNAYNMSPSSSPLSTTDCRSSSPVSSSTSPSILTFSDQIPNGLVNKSPSHENDSQLSSVQLTDHPTSSCFRQENIFYPHRITPTSVNVSFHNITATHTLSTAKSDGPRAGLMPCLIYVSPSDNVIGGKTLKRINTNQDSDCSPSKRLSPSTSRIPSDNIRTDYAHTDDSQNRSTATSIEQFPHLKKLLFHNNQPLDEDDTLYQQKCSSKNYTPEELNEQLHQKQFKISQIQRSFNDYKSVVRNLVEAHDEYVFPYFQEMSKFDVASRQIDNEENTKGGVNSAGEMEERICDLAKTMEDTVRVMVSFAMAIPGFAELPKGLKIDLIRYTRQEFCLLNLFNLVNTKLDVYGDLIQNTRRGGTTQANNTKYTNCLDVMVGFMSKFRDLNLTHQECVVLRALAILAPDRISSDSSLDLPVIYDQLVTLLIHLLSKRMDSPMFFFAKIMSLITEFRSQEKEITAYFREMNLVSSMPLNDKPLLKLLYSVIYN